MGETRLESRRTWILNSSIFCESILMCGREGAERSRNEEGHLSVPLFNETAICVRTGIGN
jgi:hypothetical protein